MKQGDTGSDTGRERCSVWVSFDGGETRPLKRLVEPRIFTYSSLSAGRQGTPSEGWIYLLYEHGSDAHPASFQRKLRCGRWIRMNVGKWMFHPMGEGYRQFVQMLTSTRSRVYSGPGRKCVRRNRAISIRMWKEVPFPSLMP